MKKTIVRGIRIDEMLVSQCDLAAAKAQLSFSAWVRKILRRVVARQS